MKGTHGGAGPGGNGQRPVVAVVDADRAVRDGVCALLESCGLEAHAYDDARALLGNGAAPPPDCVVLDRDLPGLPLSEALERIRDLAGGTPVVVMLACPDARVTFALLRAGVAEVLEKPFPPERLIDRLTAILSSPDPRDP